MLDADDVLTAEPAMPAAPFRGGEQRPMFFGEYQRPEKFVVTRFRALYQVHGDTARHLYLI